MATSQKHELALNRDEIRFVKLLSSVFQNLLDSGNIPDLSSPSADFSTDGLAAHLRISKKTVYLRAGKNSPNPFPFKTYRTGRKLRFRRSEVDEAYRKGVI